MLNEGIGKKPKPFSSGMFVSAFQAQLKQHLGVISRSAAGPEQSHTKHVYMRIISTCLLQVCF